MKHLVYTCVQLSRNPQFDLLQLQHAKLMITELTRCPVELLCLSVLPTDGLCCAHIVRIDGVVLLFMFDGQRCSKQVVLFGGEGGGGRRERDTEPSEI